MTMPIPMPLVLETLMNAGKHTWTDHITNIYLRGSRGVGAAEITNSIIPSKSTDFDFVVVIADEYPVINDSLTRYQDLDIVVYNVTEWKETVLNFTIWALECIYLPSMNIPKNTIDMKAELDSYMSAVPDSVWHPKLLASVQEQVFRKYRRARKHWIAGRQYEAMKDIFIAIRFTTYAISMVNHHRIEDITSANSIWKDMLGQYEYDKYKAFFLDLFKQFKKMIFY